MLRTLQDALRSIRSDDLMGQAGSVSGAELEGRLSSLASEAKQRRDRELRERRERGARGEPVAAIKRLPMDKSGRIMWEDAATSSLFIAKRAKTLADLLFSRRVLQRRHLSPEDVRKSEEVQRAFTIAAREIRKVGLASRLLELNVCGAVAPYNDLLVGKLAALAVASAEISRAYKTRYSAKVSEIASQMAGRAVVRAADVCVVGTTSLYGVAASQYNRLKVTVPVKGNQPGVVEWKDLGLTEGFGTSQFSEETVSALRVVSVQRRGGRRVNNLFGEGQSPRLRQVREALDDLGLDSNGLLRHSTPRRVYSLDLFPGARDSLCLNESSNANLPEFSMIAASWTQRWLEHRITFRPALDRVATQAAETVRRDLTAPPDSQLSLFAEQQPSLQSLQTQPRPQPGASLMRSTSNPTSFGRCTVRRVVVRITTMRPPCDSSTSRHPSTSSLESARRKAVQSSLPATLAMGRRTSFVDLRRTFRLRRFNPSWMRTRTPMTS